MFIAATAKIRRKSQDWIDDQFAGAVIRADSEPGAIRPSNDEFAMHGTLFPGNHLIHTRSL